ncbi:MAG: DUF5698 domain-containing protein [Chloroflexota bacterium]
MVSALLSALTIFGIRVIDISLYTVRIMMVVQGKKGLAWGFAFCQSLFYVNALLVVLTGLDNWLNIIGYAAGFATGNVVGMWLEVRFAIGYTNLRIISSGHGQGLGEKLRSAGYGVTELTGRGRDGMVARLECSVRRRDIGQVVKIIKANDADAFITVEKLQDVRFGYFRPR